MEYIPRLIDNVLEEYLQIFGAVLITGPKWCGKSTTAKRYAKSVLEVQNSVTRDNTIAIANTRPDLLLEGDKPKLIDEWQDIPTIWDTIRYDVDNTGLKGQYILTGSVTPRAVKPMHTGTGRIARLLMRPMSLYESHESSGIVSLKDLFDGKKITGGKTNAKLEDIAYYCLRGGFPGAIDVSAESAAKISKAYYEQLINEDIKTVDGVERNSQKIKSILRSLARNDCTSTSIETIKNDIIESGTSISDKTVADYINALMNLYVIENVEAWSPKLRSKTEMRTTPKRYFIDPSIAMASLKASDKDLLHDFNTFGFIFENLCIRDLQTYAKTLDGEVLFYRDKNGLEVDAIIHLDNGSWGAIEIKLGSEDKIEEGSNNLKKLASIVDEGKMNKPSFLMVVTATEYAYLREDGVYVVPITCLKN